MDDADGADIRRLDWRFLLPDPAIGTVHLDGTVDAALRRALDGAATRVTGPGAASADRSALIPRDGGRDLSDELAVDLAVLVEPTADQVRHAIAHVRPGGSLYLELAPPHRRLVRGRFGRRLGPRAAARLLVAGGTTEPVARWHWPSHRDALELVPLGDRAAMEVSLGRRRGRFGRLAADLLRRVAATSWLAPALPAVSVVAHRPRAPFDDPAPAGRIPADFASATLLARDHPDHLGTDAGLRSVVLTPRHRASRHVVFLVVDAAGASRWVAKAPRDPADRAALDREARVLERLGSEPVASGIAPSLVAAPRSSGWPVLVETMVVGRTLDRAAIHADADSWAEQATSLAEALSRAADDAVHVDRFERLVARPLAALREGVVADGDPLRIAELVDRTLERLSARRWADLPPVLEHGDLAPPNLIVTATGELAAIDWELAEPAGLPGHDLASFLAFAATARASAAAIRDVTAAARVVLTAFEHPDSWAAHRLRAHLAGLGIDPAWAPDLATAAFARIAASMPARTGRPPAAWLAQDRHLAWWRHLVERSA